ncbi:uncharacterized protein LOC123421191 [Hordeum vulgare subsp. vulgare]|uniref:Pectinesterase inhibitor domain-containing protein n=1 Tax=Hordeum vulgare subsp. vulgare TaxID=112509 RepID=A0A8I7B4B5_HORVV|nr:uncharacterized protein LOC123421191 [Hordeum vulgare subsp. vulgare]
MVMSMLPYTYPLALLIVLVVLGVAAPPALVRSDPEPGPSVEAINATCATASSQVYCRQLLLDNLDVRTPEVKDVIGMSVQVAAKKAAEAAAVYKANKNPSKCIAGCIHDLAVLTKMIDAVRDPAVLKTAKDAGYDEFDSRNKKCGNDCTIDMSNQERADQMAFVFAEGALHVTDDLLKRRAFFNQKKA